MLAKIVQTLVVLAVVCANIYFEVGLTNFAAAVNGAFLALAMTWAYWRVRDWLTYRRQRGQPFRLQSDDEQ